MENRLNDDDRTLYVGNITSKVSRELLFELFLQAGPVQSVHIPKDCNGRQRNFAFVKFKHLVSVDYAINLMSSICMFDSQLNLRYTHKSSKGQDRKDGDVPKPTSDDPDSRMPPGRNRYDSFPVPPAFAIDPYRNRMNVPPRFFMPPQGSMWMPINGFAQEQHQEEDYARQRPQRSYQDDRQRNPVDRHRNGYESRHRNHSPYRRPHNDDRRPSHCHRRR